MPVFDFFHWAEETGYTLEETGPLIQVVISMPPALEESLRKQGMAAPSPVSGWALIDTGASSTSVEESALQGLGLPPIDRIGMSTPSGSSQTFVYAASVSFPGIHLADFPLGRVIGCNLNWKTRAGQNIIMLLGRDLLKYFLMVYNGKFSDITLAY